jgi:hypothetical protein
MRILFWRIGDDRIAEVAQAIAKRALGIAQKTIAKQASAAGSEIDALNAAVARAEDLSEQLNARLKRVRAAFKEL